MTPREAQFVSFRAPKSKLGRVKFSFYYGSLIFGLVAFAGSLLFGHFLFDKPITRARALIGFPIWLITGFFAFGWFQWPVNEKRYQQLVNHVPKEDARGSGAA